MLPDFAEHGAAVHLNMLYGFSDAAVPPYSRFDEDGFKFPYYFLI